MVNISREDNLAYILSPKSNKARNRLMWLDIMHQQWVQYKGKNWTQDELVIIKDTLKICSEESLRYK